MRNVWNPDYAKELRIQYEKLRKEIKDNDKDVRVRCEKPSLESIDNDKESKAECEKIHHKMQQGFISIQG